MHWPKDGDNKIGAMLHANHKANSTAHLHPLLSGSWPSDDEMLAPGDDVSARYETELDRTSQTGGG